MDDSTAQLRPSKLWRVIYVLNLAFVLSLLAYTIIASRKPPAASTNPDPAVPGYVRDAPKLDSSPTDALERAETLIQEKKVDEALPLLGAVVKHADDPSLQSKALLLAAVTLGSISGDDKQAMNSLMYFKKMFSDQAGIDNAKYQLALLYLARGELAKGQLQLAELLRDYPQSPFAGSASFLAARTAEFIDLNETSPNGAIGRLVSTALPSNSLALIGFVISVLVTIVSTHLSHRDKLQKGQPSTVVLVIVLVTLSAISSVLNIRLQSQQAQALASSSSPDARTTR